MCICEKKKNMKVNTKSKEVICFMVYIL